MISVAHDTQKRPRVLIATALIDGNLTAVSTLRLAITIRVI